MMAIEWDGSDCTFVVQDDITSGLLNVVKLCYEIQKLELTPVLEYMNTKSNAKTAALIHFDVVPSSGNKTSINNKITNHDGQPINNDAETLADLINYELLTVDGAYVIHRINLLCISQSPPDYAQLYRFASCPTMAGFSQFCDVYQWQFSRQMAADAVTAGYITQDDYDLIDGLLPPNP